MRGTVTSKCMRRHRKAEKRCGSRCLRWYFVIEGRKTADGKRQREWSKGYANKAAATEALADELARRNRGVIIKGGCTVAELADRWVDFLNGLDRDAATVDRYARALRNHVTPAIGHLMVRDLEPQHLDALYADLLRSGRKDGRKHDDGRPLGLSARSVGQIHGVIHQMLSRAKRWRLVVENVADGLDLPKVERRKQQALTYQQASALLAAAKEDRWLSDWLYPVVLLGLSTGARIGELLALTWHRVDLETGTVEIGASRRVVRGQVEVKGPKTDAGYRRVILGPTTVAMLRKLHAEQAGRRLMLGVGYDTVANLVICKADGAPLRPDTATKAFRRFVDRVGLPRWVHTHTLRHAAASFLSAAGVVAPDIAEQLGHADGGGLAQRTYIRPLPEGLARAGEVLDRVVRGEV